MLIIDDIQVMSQWSAAKRESALAIGLVPTMGAIHQGHVSLIHASQSDCDVTVVSIFVNPTQFNDKSDFDTYPRTLQEDIKILEEHSVDVLFVPNTSQMYPSGFDTSINPGAIENVLEGASRPLHFRAVATVVTKLINIVSPHKAFFGKKDRQQLLAIERVVSDLNFSTQIIGRDTIREPDGLAMSSRNVRLSPAERRAAQTVVTAQMEIIRLFSSGEVTSSVLCEAGLQILQSEKMCTVDYLEILDARDLNLVTIADEYSLVCLAVTIGSVRLIDNMDLQRPV